MRGIEINYITKEGETVDNERFLDSDKERPDPKELATWLSENNQTIELCLNEYLPDGEEDSFSFNDCFGRITIKNTKQLLEFNTNEYKIF